MLAIVLGALLVVGGVLYMAAQPIWRGRLSERRTPATPTGDTLEPEKPAAGFGLAANWPGLALVALGALLLLAGAVL